jgi:hypothetical protein
VKRLFPTEWLARDRVSIDFIGRISETKQMINKIRTLAFLTLMAALAACTASEKKITGTIEISPELQKAIGPKAALYVIARPEGQTAGPPIAVKRFTQPIFFPLEFNLSARDAMMPDAPFDGKYAITVRIAQSGSATPASPGDIEGTAPTPSVPVGENKLKIVMNHVR